MKYIDADKLKEDIQANLAAISFNDDYQKGYEACGMSVLKSIESLQQEQLIQVNTLTWKDINDLERIINNVHYEFRNGIGEKSFGEEVLERFREERDEQEQPDDVVVIAKTLSL